MLHQNLYFCNKNTLDHSSLLWSLSLPPQNSCGTYSCLYCSPGTLDMLSWTVDFLFPYTLCCLPIEIVKSFRARALKWLLHLLFFECAPFHIEQWLNWEVFDWDLYFVFYLWPIGGTHWVLDSKQLHVDHLSDTGYKSFSSSDDSD